MHSFEELVIAVEAASVRSEVSHDLDVRHQSEGWIAYERTLSDLLVFLSNSSSFRQDGAVTVYLAARKGDSGSLANPAQLTSSQCAVLFKLMTPAASHSNRFVRELAVKGLVHVVLTSPFEALLAETDTMPLPPELPAALTAHLVPEVVALLQLPPLLPRPTVSSVRQGCPPLYPPSLLTACALLAAAALDDAWSQVRLCGATLATALLIRLAPYTTRDSPSIPTDATDAHLTSSTPATVSQRLRASADIATVLLLPRLCVNRYYLAEGVRCFALSSWRSAVRDDGRAVCAASAVPLTAMACWSARATNHAVRESAALVLAEFVGKVLRFVSPSTVPEGREGGRGAEEVLDNGMDEQGGCSSSDCGPWRFLDTTSPPLDSCASASADDGDRIGAASFDGHAAAVLLCAAHNAGVGVAPVGVAGSCQRQGCPTTTTTASRAAPTDNCPRTGSVERNEGRNEAPDGAKGFASGGLGAWDVSLPNDTLVAITSTIAATVCELAYDDSWPVRDVAVVAVGRMLAASVDMGCSASGAHDAASDAASAVSVSSGVGLSASSPSIAGLIVRSVRATPPPLPAAVSHLVAPWTGVEGSEPASLPPLLLPHPLAAAVAAVFTGESSAPRDGSAAPRDGSAAPRDGASLDPTVARALVDAASIISTAGGASPTDDTSTAAAPITSPAATPSPAAAATTIDATPSAPSAPIPTCRLPWSVAVTLRNLCDEIPSVRRNAAGTLAVAVAAQLIPASLIASLVAAAAAHLPSQSRDSTRFGDLTNATTFGVAKSAFDNDVALHTGKPAYSCGTLQLTRTLPQRLTTAEAKAMIAARSSAPRHDNSGVRPSGPGAAAAAAAAADTGATTAAAAAAGPAAGGDVSSPPRASGDAPLGSSPRRGSGAGTATDSAAARGPKMRSGHEVLQSTAATAAHSGVLVAVAGDGAVTANISGISGAESSGGCCDSFHAGGRIEAEPWAVAEGVVRFVGAAVAAAFPSTGCAVASGEATAPSLAISSSFASNGSPSKEWTARNDAAGGTERGTGGAATAALWRGVMGGPSLEGSPQLHPLAAAYSRQVAEAISASLVSLVGMLRVRHYVHYVRLWETIFDEISDICATVSPFIVLKRSQTTASANANTLGGSQRGLDRGPFTEQTLESGTATDSARISPAPLVLGPPGSGPAALPSNIFAVARSRAAAAQSAAHPPGAVHGTMGNSITASFAQRLMRDYKSVPMIATEAAEVVCNGLRAVVGEVVYTALIASEGASTATAAAALRMRVLLPEEVASAMSSCPQRAQATVGA